MSERPGPKKLTKFQWWLCFWLAMLALNQPGRPTVKVYVDGNSIQRQGGHHEIRCDANRPT